MVGMNLPVLLLCGLIGAVGSAVNMAPQRLVASDPVDWSLPPAIDILNSKGLIEVKVKIENAVSGTSIVVTNSSNAKIIGVITPFGIEGRSTVESFSLPLSTIDSGGPLYLTFALKMREASVEQNISILSVIRK
jgi:hypothetical protein